MESRYDYSDGIDFLSYRREEKTTYGCFCEIEAYDTEVQRRLTKWSVFPILKDDQYFEILSISVESIACFLLHLFSSFLIEIE